jgi:hypothetical protein
VNQAKRTAHHRHLPHLVEAAEDVVEASHAGGGRRGRGEARRDGEVELGRKHGARGLARERRHVVLQPRERGDDLLRDEVGAARRDLAELDVPWNGWDE